MCPDSCPRSSHFRKLRHLYHFPWPSPGWYPVPHLLWLGPMIPVCFTKPANMQTLRMGETMWTKGDWFAHMTHMFCRCKLGNSFSEKQHSMHMRTVLWLRNEVLYFLIGSLPCFNVLLFFNGLKYVRHVSRNNAENTKSYTFFKTFCSLVYI